jgi:hypothetical protein
MDDPNIEPPSTRRLWADMFGLGDLYRVVTDPGLITQTHAMVGAITDAVGAMRRIEAKLDRLLAEYGIDVNAMESGTVGTASLPLQHGPNGTGGHPTAGGAVDDGNSVVAAIPHDPSWREAG